MTKNISIHFRQCILGDSVHEITMKKIEQCNVQILNIA